MECVPDPAIRLFVQRSGLAGSCEPVLIPLTGGVASDIFLVEAPARRFAVKRALPQLRVAQRWEAPVSRNRSEVAWLRVAATVAPGAVPDVLAADAELGCFAMTYLEPVSHPVWKRELAAGRAERTFAAAVGRILAAIHAATANSEELRRSFANDAVFHAIRLEPYLEATAAVHPDLAGALMQLSADTLAGKRALVHGDVSPKNILAGPHGPVFLDAECAWYGEPAFDLAFCLNHLLLKCVWVPSAAAAFLDCFDALAAAYLAGVVWEGAAAFEARAARLLPALLLARVDGKSPVEYLTDEAGKMKVRRFARRFVAQPPTRLAAIRDSWPEAIAP